MAKRAYNFRTFRTERMGLMVGILALLAFAFYLTD